MSKVRKWTRISRISVSDLCGPGNPNPKQRPWASARSAVSKCRRNGRGDRHRIGVHRASLFFALSAGAAEASARLNELPSYSARPRRAHALGGRGRGGLRLCELQSARRPRVIVIATDPSSARRRPRVIVIAIDPSSARRRLHNSGEATSASLRCALKCAAKLRHASLVLFLLLEEMTG